MSFTRNHGERVVYHHGDQRTKGELVDSLMLVTGYKNKETAANERQQQQQNGIFTLMIFLPYFTLEAQLAKIDIALELACVQTLDKKLKRWSRVCATEPLFLFKGSSKSSTTKNYVELNRFSMPFRLYLLNLIVKVKVSFERGREV